MVELPQRHLRADILTHGDECDTEDSEGLEGIISLFLLLCLLFLSLPILLLLLLGFLLFRGVNVLVAIVEHCLHPQNVSSTSKGASFDQDLSRLGDGMLDSLERLDRRVRSVLQA